MRKTVLVVLSILIGLGGCRSTPQPQIAFQGVDENGYTQIYLVDLNGGNLTQLTDIPYSDGWPVWSPDGQQIVFHSERDHGDENTYIMNTDGSNVRKFIGTAWSPDEEWIAYSSRLEDGDLEIFKKNIQTGEIVQLTDNDDLWDESPSWSPSGEKIVYSSGISASWGSMDLIVIDADGSNRKVLVDNEDFVFSINPKWSPQGDKILFLSNENQEVSGYQLYLYDINEKEIFRVMDEEILVWANWSPDGGRIIFNSYVKIGEREVLGREMDDVHKAIFVINADGTGLMEIPIEGVESPAGGAWRP